MYNSKNKNKVLQYKVHMQKKVNGVIVAIEINKNKKKIRNWGTLIKKIEEQKMHYIFCSAPDLLSRLKIITCT